MFTIPSKTDKVFYQPNKGDTFGSIYSSKNADTISNLGRLRATRSFKVVTSVALTDVVNAIAYFNFDNSGGQDVVIGNDQGVWTSLTPVQTFTLDVTSGTPTDVTDLEVFNNNIYAATSSTTVKYKAKTGNWLTLTSGLTSGTTHMLQQYGDRLYVTDGNKVFSSNTSNVFVTTGSYTLDLSVFYGDIAFIKASSNRLWIGLNKNDGTKAMIFEWDGQSENLWSKNYLTEASKLATCVIKDDIPYVLDSEGRLLAFNGSGFQEVSRLIHKTNTYYVSHYNGATAFNDSIMLNVNGGIYQYKKDSGIMHYTSPSLSPISGSIVDYGSLYDYGTIGYGAIMDISDFPNLTGDYFGDLLYGSRMLDSAGNISYVLCADIGINNTSKAMAGYITTPMLESNNVEDVWKATVIKYKKLLNTSDKIITKYKTSIIEPFIYSGTWVNSTQFTAIVAGGGPVLFDYISVGYEVEILTGNGSGQVTHITNISNVGSTYTITLKDSIVGVSAGNESVMKYDNWIELPSITKSEVQFSNIPLMALNKNVQMQFKIYYELTNLFVLQSLFTGEGNINVNELYEIMVVNDTEQHAK